jgi:gamma-glutamyltranspeptidase/glutathione hydrolase
VTRGLFALHARLGRMRWAELISPGERLARFGFETSRALARDLALAGGGLVRDPGARAIFAGAAGTPHGEGARLQQLDLAAQLGRIRAEGPAAFYAGTGAQAYAAGAAALGGTLTAEELRDYRPTWRPTVKSRFGSHVGHFAGPPPAGGLVAAELWAILGDGGHWNGAGAAERPHLLAEAAARLADAPPPAVDARGRIAQDWADRAMRGYDPARHAARPAPAGAAPEDGQSTGLIVMDYNGDAVACVLTAGRAFGAGRVVPGTGVVAGTAPDAAAERSLAPMIVVNENSKDTFLAAAGSGDAAAPEALVSVLLPLFEDRVPLDRAVAAPRSAPDAAADATLVETGGDAIAQALAARGHRVGRVGALGRVNAMYCAGGVVRAADTCAVAAEPRGLGIAEMDR